MTQLGAEFECNRKPGNLFRPFICQSGQRKDTTTGGCHQVFFCPLYGNKLLSSVRNPVRDILH